MITRMRGVELHRIEDGYHLTFSLSRKPRFQAERVAS